VTPWAQATVCSAVERGENWEDLERGRYRDAERWLAEAEAQLEHHDTFATVSCIRALGVGIAYFTGDALGAGRSWKRPGQRSRGALPASRGGRCINDCDYGRYTTVRADERDHWRFTWHMCSLSAKVWPRPAPESGVSCDPLTTNFRCPSSCDTVRATRSRSQACDHVCSVRRCVPANDRQTSHAI